MKWYSRRPGRPQGSKTKQATPGKKRAREFIELQIDKELRPTRAAKLISEKYGVEVAQIFKDTSRHQEAIVREAWAEADRAKRDFEEILAATIGPHMPNDVRSICAWIALTSLKGQRI